MRFFLQRALPQEFLHILFASQGALGLIMKFRLLPFFGRFHPANSKLRSGNFVPPTVEPAPNRVLQNRRFWAEVFELFLAALGMSLLRFRPTTENPFALLISLAARQVGRCWRRLHLGPPAPLDRVA